MRSQLISLFLLLLMLPQLTIKAQYTFLTKAPAEERLKALWRYCSGELISDKDPAVTVQFLEGVTNVADSLGDEQLKKYAYYFRLCSKVFFSSDYRQYFAKGDYESSAAIFKNAKTWALKNGHADIVAASEHYIGQVYFHAARYGLAFEHLLKADEAFRRIGYKNVPPISIYLHDLALDYYKFEEYDKSLAYFLSASRYPAYLPGTEMSTLNSIGLIYARKKEWDKAVLYYLKTIEKAKVYNNAAWVGIASGNLGNVFLSKGQNDSALFYHRKNYYINISSLAPEDAAKSALVIATTLIRQQQLDSAANYIRSGEQLAGENIRDPAERLEYKRRLLVVMIELNKAKGDYKPALLLSDSLGIIKDSLQQMLDAKILNRAVEKAEAEQYSAELKLMESQKSISQLRLYLLIAVLVGMMITAALLFNKFRVRKLRQAQLAEKEKTLLSVEKLQAEENLKHAEKLLTAYLTTIKEKTTLIENLEAALQQEETSNTDVSTIAANMDKLASSTIFTKEEWRDFRSLFEQVYPGFLDRLEEKFPVLSPAETRLLILTKLNLSSREMAQMLGVSLETLRKSRYRLRKKLNLDEESSIDVLIQQI